jgi:DDE superfamily endonuclease
MLWLVLDRILLRAQAPQIKSDINSLRYRIFDLISFGDDSGSRPLANLFPFWTSCFRKWTLLILKHARWIHRTRRLRLNYCLQGGHKYRMLSIPLGSPRAELKRSMLPARSSLRPARRGSRAGEHDVIDYGLLEAALAGLPEEEAGAVREACARWSRLRFAIDATPYPRPDAECSPEREHVHHDACRCDGARKSIPGWEYQFVAAVGHLRTAWTALIDVERATKASRTSQTARQVRNLLRRLRVSGQAGRRGAPLVICDAGYSAAALTAALSGLRVARGIDTGRSGSVSGFHSAGISSGASASWLPWSGSGSGGRSP